MLLIFLKIHCIVFVRAAGDYVVVMPIFVLMMWTSVDGGFG